MSIRCTIDERRFTRRAIEAAAAGRITTGLWPGFPSDLVSLVTVLATQADGPTLVHDWLYELRLFALEQLSGMGADLFLCDPHRIIVTGPKRLRGRPLDSRDLRSGMALIAAALAADGQSQLAPLETVERGYGRLVERLRALGGRVEKVAARQRGGTGDRGLGRWSADGSAAGGGSVAAAEAVRAAGRLRGDVAPDAERAEVGFVKIEHPDDVRRQRQDDVGLFVVFVVCANNWPMPGRSLSPGMPSSDCRSSSRISPASMLVSPSRSRIAVLISRLPNVGRPPNRRARDAASPRSSASATRRRRGGCAA